MMRGGRQVQGFALGTSAGVQTVQDLDKLIKEKDFEMSLMAAGVTKSADPSIQQDWAALSKAYGAARAAGLKAIADIRGRFGGSLVPDSLLGSMDTTDAAFKGIIAALQPVPMQVTEGSKQDIANRLMAAGWKEPELPHDLKWQSDADLTFFRDTDPSNIHNSFDDFLKWFKDHKTALIVGGSVVGGVVVLGVLSPYVKLLTAVVPHRR